MTRLIRIALFTPRNIDPRKPLTGLALKLVAIGALSRSQPTLEEADVRRSVGGGT